MRVSRLLSCLRVDKELILEATLHEIPENCQEREACAAVSQLMLYDSHSVTLRCSLAGGWAHDLPPPAEGTQGVWEGRTGRKALQLPLTDADPMKLQTELPRFKNPVSLRFRDKLSDT